MKILRSYQGEDRIETISKPEIVIGRGTTDHPVDVDLAPDGRVAPRHARLLTDCGEWWVEDCGSHEGTHVLGERIQGRTRIEPGEFMRMGHTTLVLVADRRSGRRPRVHVECEPALQLALFNAGVPLTAQIELLNEGDRPLTDIRVVLTVEGYLEAQFQTVPYLAPHTTILLGRPYLSALTMDRWLNVAGPIDVPVEVWDGDDRLEVRPPVSVRLLPPDAWTSTRHMAALAGFVVPGSAAVQSTVQRARPHLGHLLAGAGSFAGAIESTHRFAADRTVEALCLAIREYHAIAYEYEPRNHAPDWQHIRSHDRVLHENAGTCVDLAVLLAACLENVHRDPVIIIVRLVAHDSSAIIQHSLVGCWRGTKSLASTSVLDAEELVGRVASGDLFVIDPTTLTRPAAGEAGMSFDEACDEAVQYLRQHDVRYAVDILRARTSGIAPLPFGRGVQYERAAWMARFRAEREADTLRSPALTARHLLLGLLGSDDSLLRRVAAGKGASSCDHCMEVARASLPPSLEPTRARPLTRPLEAILEAARRMAESRNSTWVTESDLILAMLQTPSQVHNALSQAGIDPKVWIDGVMRLFETRAVTSVWYSSDPG